jgi:hypothetical protein
MIGADELLALVYFRLHDGDVDDDRMQDWHTAHPASPEVAARNLKRFHYSNAKDLARRGNVEPLRKILTQLTGDPDIANFITAPPAPPRPKYARKDASNPFYNKHAERQQQAETLRRIRQIIQQEMGTTRNTSALVIDITRKVTGWSRDEILELMKRGR